MLGYGVRTVPGSVCICQDGRRGGVLAGRVRLYPRRALILRVPSRCLSHGNSQDKSKGGSDLRFDLEQERFDLRIPTSCYESQLGGLHLSKHPPPHQLGARVKNNSFLNKWDKTPKTQTTLPQRRRLLRKCKADLSPQISNARTFPTHRKGT